MCKKIQATQMCHFTAINLRKITVISRITLRAHFSLDIAQFDTLSNLLLTLDGI